MIKRSALAAGLLLALLVTMNPSFALSFKTETYTLPNGLTVILHEDHRLPQVVINTWFYVGSKDEARGRTGFAHLFEHLMFMGTKRVPGNQFDVLMETGGGQNNASTGNDRTSYYSTGPSSLLPLLVWLDADRMDSLGASMTKEKVDLQRDVVRNERRQTTENTPYGIVEIILPEALYPAGHPYAHSVIGSHEDLEAATFEDVKKFFDAFYVTTNATLVVAGDFDPKAVKELIGSTFGLVPLRPAPAPAVAQPVTLEQEVRRVILDNVELPKLYLVWPAPPAYKPGTAELNLLAPILGEGSSSRLEKRLIQELHLAQEVVVYLDDRQLGSEFHVEIKAAPGADLERIKRETLAVIEEIRQNGPTEKELKRVKAQHELGFLNATENLLQRANLMNNYRFYLGEANSFDRDLARYAAVEAAAIKETARRFLGEGRVDLRVLPKEAPPAKANLDQRPVDFPERPFLPPNPKTVKLSNGLEVIAVEQPGSGLFSGQLITSGGDRRMSAEKAGLSALTARMATAGAGGRSAADFADAVASLGAAVDANPGRNTMSLSVTGLVSRLAPTLDLFADAVLRPNLAQDDFLREKGLAIGRIKARVEEPNRVAALVATSHVFGPDDYRGRALDGYLGTMEKLTLADVQAAYPQLFSLAGAKLVFVGDFKLEEIQRELETRFGKVKIEASPVPPAPAPLTKNNKTGFVVVNRPGAPQTVIFALRPIPAADDNVRALRGAANTVLGGTFTSRLNQNLREKHGYTYGAASRIAQDLDQFTLLARSSVQSEVTGAALTEMKNEFASLAQGNLTGQEIQKAVRSLKQDQVERVETVLSLAGTLADFVSDGRPVDSLARERAGLDAATLEKANAEARSGLFDWEQLLIVLVGDQKTILEQLQNAKFPKPAFADSEGKPVQP